MVDDLDDDGDLANVWAGAEEGDTANLHQLPRACRHVCVAHLAGVEHLLPNPVSLIGIDSFGMCLLRTRRGCGLCELSKSLLSASIVCGCGILECGGLTQDAKALKIACIFDFKKFRSSFHYHINNGVFPFESFASRSRSSLKPQKPYLTLFCTRRAGEGELASIPTAFVKDEIICD